MTGFPASCAYLEGILPPDHVESLSPLIDPIFHQSIPCDEGDGIERFSKASAIVRQLRALAHEISVYVPDISLVSGSLVTGPDRVFFQELSAATGTKIDYSLAWEDAPVERLFDELGVLAMAKNACRNNDPWFALTVLEKLPLEELSDPDLARVYAKACLMTNRAVQALWVLEGAASQSREVRATLAYEKAIIWLRHLPIEWRSRDKLRELFVLSLAEAKDASPISQALCLNGYALFFVETDLEQAIATQRESLRLFMELDSSSTTQGAEAILRGNLARLLAAGGQWSEALSMAKLAHDLEPLESGHATLLLDVAVQVNDLNETQRVVDRLEGFAERNDVNALISLGNYWDGDGDRAKAGDYFRRCLRLAPEYDDVRIRLCGLLLLDGQIEEVEDLLRLRSPNPPPEVASQYALLALEVDSRGWEPEAVVDNAVAGLQALADLYPDDFQIRDNLASLLGGANDN